jgi:hypothetical protein
VEPPSKGRQLVGRQRLDILLDSLDLVHELQDTTIQRRGLTFGISRGRRQRATEMSDHPAPAVGCMPWLAG